MASYFIYFIPLFIFFQASVTSQSTDFLPAVDDDALSVHSDFSEASEMVSFYLKQFYSTFTAAYEFMSCNISKENLWKRVFNISVNDC